MLFHKSFKLSSLFFILFVPVIRRILLPCLWVCWFFLSSTQSSQLLNHRIEFFLVLLLCSSAGWFPFGTSGIFKNIFSLLKFSLSSCIVLSEKEGKRQEKAETQKVRREQWRKKYQYWEWPRDMYINSRNTIFLTCLLEYNCFTVLC